jgi:TRAP-type mannitol/chloroaromatic compound transport system permease large subunit
VDTARSLAVGDWGLLAMMMIMIFVMGFFFDWIEITLIVLPIFAPIVQIMDLGDHVAQRRPDLLVRGACGGESADLVPDAALWLRAVLPQGRGGGAVTMAQVYRGIIPFVLLQVASSAC